MVPGTVPQKFKYYEVMFFADFGFIMKLSQQLLTTLDIEYHVVGCTVAQMLAALHLKK